MGGKSVTIAATMAPTQDSDHKIIHTEIKLQCPNREPEQNKETKQVISEGAQSLAMACGTR